MISKVIAGISAGMILLGGCALDSLSNAPIAVTVAGVLLLGLAVMTNKEVFE